MITKVEIFFTTTENKESFTKSSHMINGRFKEFLAKHLARPLF